MQNGRGVPGLALPSGTVYVWTLVPHGFFWLMSSAAHPYAHWSHRYYQCEPHPWANRRIRDEPWAASRSRSHGTGTLYHSAYWAKLQPNVYLSRLARATDSTCNATLIYTQKCWTSESLRSCRHYTLVECRCHQSDSYIRCLSPTPTPIPTVLIWSAPKPRTISHSKQSWS
jgi:hypothetical protein